MEGEAKLRLFSLSPEMTSPPDPSGILTPPLQGCSAAVPFQWEEQPGRPRLCSAVIPTTAEVARLELPPRLVKHQPSPTTMFEGKRPKALSFRIPMRRRKESYGSLSYSSSPERSSPRRKEKGWLYRALRKIEMKGKGRSEVAAGDTLVFPADTDFEVQLKSSLKTKMITKTSRLYSSQPNSHFWATIYGGMKQVMPWKRNKTG